MLKNVTYLWDQKKHILPSCWDNRYDPFSVPLPWNPQCPELWMKCSWGENPLSLMLHGVGTQFQCESEGHRAELNMSNTVIYVIIKLLTRFSMALMVLTASLTLDLADTWCSSLLSEALHESISCGFSVLVVFASERNDHASGRGSQVWCSSGYINTYLVKSFDSGENNSAYRIHSSRC